MGYAYLLEFRFEIVFQSQRYVGVLGCIVDDLLGRQVSHRLLLFALRSDKLLYVYGLISETRLSHVVHVVAKLGLDEVVGYHRVEQLTCHAHAVACQHLHVVLDILSYFDDFGVFV